MTGLADLAGKRIGTAVRTRVSGDLVTVLSGAGVQAEAIGGGPDLVPVLARGNLVTTATSPAFAAPPATGRAPITLNCVCRVMRCTSFLPRPPEMTGARTDTRDAFMAALAAPGAVSLP
ncbi:hypothetical protein C357_02194 [Citreicella sp. 357]|nr:hypothetical protein C357_02194 [Citreicella sp. 357]